MNGFLIDCSAASRVFSGLFPLPGATVAQENVNSAAHFNAVPSSDLVFVSAITWGEFAFGHELTMSGNPQRRLDYQQWLASIFKRPLDVTRHTAQIYGEIKAELFRKYPPASPKQNHPERCLDQVTGTELGIDENDLWIAAQSIERNLVLVSGDRMKRICYAAGTPLDLVNWEVP